MTKENWIAVGQIVAMLTAAFCAPLINSWFQHRLKVASESSRVVADAIVGAKREGRGEYIRVQLGTFVLMILLPISMLGYLLTKETPVTRSEVLSISICVVAVFLGMCLMAIVSGIQHLVTKLTSEWTEAAARLKRV